MWGPIDTLRDVPLSPVIWTSVATGKNPSKHGVTWFLVDQPDGTRIPVRSTNRKTLAIWNVLAKNDLSPADGPQPSQGSPCEGWGPSAETISGLTLRG